nr:unnamed protein product [Callosobruchus chinensis]
MDANHIQSYFYVAMLLDKLIKFRSRSVEALGVLNYSTEVFLESLGNITSNQHSTHELQPQSMDVGDNRDESFSKGILNDVSTVHLRSRYLYLGRRDIKINLVALKM